MKVEPVILHFESGGTFLNCDPGARQESCRKMFEEAKTVMTQAIPETSNSPRPSR